MDLYSTESKKIISLVQDWINYPEHELEATFGINGEVDSTTFLQIAQRLRVKGFDVIPQDDRLSIITPDHIRLSLQGLGVLQQYCKDDKLTGKPFTAMIKDRTSQESNVDLQEYNVRVKARREVPLSQDDPRIRDILDKWSSQRKAFRLIRRWTFRGKGIRIDMSAVRSTKHNENGSYRWVKSFQEYNIFKEPTHYEVEVELLRNEFTTTADLALKALISGIGEVLRASQKNTLLIRNSIRDKVKTEYANMIKSDRFRGVAPVTLDIKNMIAEVEENIPNIRMGYNVTDKADGLRTMGYCNKEGELFLIDMSMNVYRTGLQNKKCAESLVDGEWITMAKDERAINHYLIFDIYYSPQLENVSTLQFVDVTNIDKGNGRYNKMKEWFNLWKDYSILAKGVTESNKLLVALKQFQFAEANTPGIFTACSRILDTTRIYETDGLIITTNTSALPQKPGETFYEQFKWKPSSQNTIDFLINFERDPNMINIEKITSGIHPTTGETIRYKTIRLFVGSDKDPAFDNPRNTILFEQEIPKGKQGSNKYKPVLFNPLEFPDTMANTCNVIVKIDPETGEEYVTTDDDEGTNEPIRDKSIIEMKYEPVNEGGWRWIPLRVRHDKTERLQRGTIARTLNSEKVANSVWNSIHDPVTESMIRTGNEEPTENEMKALVKSRDTDVAKKYYERKASEEDIMLVRGMLDFHNKYIKNDILYKRLLRGGGKSVLDIACGKGGDLYKWIFNKARIVVGVDTAGENITNSRDGAYKRYLDSIVEFGKNRVPQIAFVIGNSSRNFVTGEAGATPEERDILRSIFGRAQVEGAVPKYIETTMAGSLRAGADVAVCMFAIHYFFENKETLDGLIKNLSETVKVGGYFAGCAFDGDKVFNLLKGVEIGHSKSGKEGDVPIWTITKQFDKEDLTADDDSIGFSVDD
jgi:SAM-dependent methyltransferase